MTLHVTVPLEEIQSSKPSERDCGVGPGLDGGSSPQCDLSLNSCSVLICCILQIFVNKHVMCARVCTFYYMLYKLPPQAKVKVLYLTNACSEIHPLLRKVQIKFRSVAVFGLKCAPSSGLVQCVVRAVMFL